MTIPRTSSTMLSTTTSVATPHFGHATIRMPVNVAQATKELIVPVIVASTVWEVLW